MLIHANDEIELSIYSVTRGGEEAALALSDRVLESAEITLGKDANDHDRAHELGHVEQAIEDPDGVLEEQDAYESVTTLEEYEELQGERYADQFAVEVLSEEE